MGEGERVMGGGTERLLMRRDEPAGVSDWLRGAFLVGTAFNAGLSEGLGRVTGVESNVTVVRVV